MRRRRRPTREVAFSFDSFLDVVANVVGIILRLIVIAWFGARSYKALVPARPLPPPTPEVAAVEPARATRTSLGSLRDQIARGRQAVRAQEECLLLVRHQHAAVAEALGTIATRREALTSQAARPARQAREQEGHIGQAILSARDLAHRADRLRQDLAAAALTGPTARLRYPAPISQEAQDEEMMFEVRKGRVTLVDTGALVKLIQAALEARSRELRERWSLTAETPAVGAFRARYTLERQRGALESALGAPPEGTFRYGATGWEAVPVREERGEAVGDALLEGSAFRRLVDSLDARQTVVTLWVYPDSFAAYRRLRDYLHGKGLVVAGRPLPEGVLIGASRHGTASRGQ